MTSDPTGRPVLPIACTLGPEDGAQRVEEWRRLSEMTGVGEELAVGTLTLRFKDVPGVREQLDRLVMAERECCAFLGWEIVASGAELHVHITGDPAELKTLTFTTSRP